ncbi:hypothetical protein K432DRAFT_305887 [Lepidopterella palustris CBS 459.81]|uniref:DUF7918 domain-containing protein n=1 Tax=Lepidopterella palustris CBS 459.81 TaxID=1314670 RepID=A0A8E2JBQ7_9PEZI|nr:hypothetical protein K432DRAFT_305887 [Lepidopterella palustris CBS 459.81]
MPCFHGLAVSIHTPDGPLPEYSIQKQSKFHRITSYIPVPPAKIPTGSTTNKPEQSTFAISITLLTPGLHVPYSTPKPTSDDPNPRPKIVGGLPGFGSDRGKNGPVIGPYLPLTQSPNETIAAYIYFDGRAKEEVATLLRRGEETWVNSRWVSVPESEGGGLAEREFLFREVGLERWLNGLDLEGKDVAARIERRKLRLEKKRRRMKETVGSEDDDDIAKSRAQKNGILRYGDDKNAPVEALSGDEGLFSSDSDSEDEPPMPEAAGQIKVALFRVLASGEIKRGEYSPQFDAHDDDENSTQNGSSGDGDADIDHTTSFAKPKTLDPKSISTQTVTGIDPPDKPYAVFTFLYRGERQLRKMGILQPIPAEDKAPAIAKRKSTGLDFTSLKPLTSTGIKNFAGYRDSSASSPPFSKSKSGKMKDEDAMDSDADDEEDSKISEEVDSDVKSENKGMLSPEDALRQGELAEGVRKIKLKRQHSAEPLNAPSPQTRKSPASNSPVSGTPAPTSLSTAATSTTIDTSANGTEPATKPSAIPSDIAPEAIVGSPFKKQRASLPGFDEGVRKGLGLDFLGASKEGKGGALGSLGETGGWNSVKREMSEDEEL